MSPRGVSRGLSASDASIWAWISIIVVLTLAALVLTPIVIILWNSFHVATPSLPNDATLENWRDVIGSNSMQAIGNTFFLLLRHPFALTLGFMIAWLLVRVQIPLSRFFEMTFWLSFFLPTLPLLVSWILLLDPHYGLMNNYIFSRLGFNLSIYSYWGITWVHLTATTVPVMVILTQPLLRSFEASLEEAARMCGARPLYAVRRIVIPLLVPGLLAVLLAGLISGIEAFQIEKILGTPVRIEVFGSRIYNLVSDEPPRWGAAMALSSLLLVVLAILAILYRSIVSKRQFATISGRGVSFRPVDIGRKKYVISGSLLIYVILSVYLPLAVLLMGSFMRLFGFFDIANPFTTDHWVSALSRPEFLRGARTSVFLGLVAAGIGVVVYAVIGYLTTRTPLRAKAIVSLLAWLPWAIPGILMGAAFLWIYLRIPPLTLLYGSVWGLVLIILIQQMPLGVHLAGSGFTQVSGHLEEAARVCGARRLHVIRRIMVPLTAPMLVTVFMITLMAALRAVDSIVLVGGAVSKPLAVLMFEYTLSGRGEFAAVIGVILSVVSMGFLLVARKAGLEVGSR